MTAQRLALVAGGLEETRRRNGKRPTREKCPKRAAYLPYNPGVRPGVSCITLALGQCHYSPRSEAEREGYVPNVVYTCGALLHGRELIIPYAMSDYATSFATVSLDELLGALV